MSDRQSGGQSPPPESQSDRQINASASGKGTDDASNKEQTNKESLEGLSSNPTNGPMDQALKDKFSKTEK